MQLYDALHDRQAETGSALAATLGFLEPFQHAVALVGRNAGAGIGDIEPQVFRFGCQPDFNIAVRRGMRNRVAQKIVGHDGQAVEITGHVEIIPAFVQAQPYSPCSRRFVMFSDYLFANPVQGNAGFHDIGVIRIMACPAQNRSLRQTGIAAGGSDTVSLSDEALANLSKVAGSSDTFYRDALTRRWMADVYRFCRGYLHDAADAEDASQEVMLRMLRGLSRYQGRSAFKTWLFKIAANVCHSRYRERQSRGIRLIPLQAMEYTVATPSDNTGEKVSSDVDFENLLAVLSSRERQVMRLRFQQDAELADIARALGMKLSAGKMCYYRALKKLQTRYHRAGPGQ